MTEASSSFFADMLAQPAIASTAEASAIFAKYTFLLFTLWILLGCCGFWLGWSGLRRRRRLAGGRNGIAGAQWREGLELLLVFLRHLLGFVGAGDDARGDQHDQLGALTGLAGAAEQAAEHGNLAQSRNAVARIAVLVLDHAAQQDRLPALHRNLRIEIALVDRGIRVVGRDRAVIR